MPPFVLSSSSTQATINKHYELALRLARRRLWSRGWSAQDVEDAAADAIIAVRLMPDSSLSDEEVMDVIGRAVDGFRARERRVRARQIHFDEPGAFDRAVEQAAPETPSEAARTREDRRRDFRTRYCRLLVRAPETAHRVRVVTLLATVCQIAPSLVSDELVDQALAASRNGQGILRSPDSFRPALSETCSELVRVMKRRPEAKQFPDQIRQMAWVFRGQEGEPYESIPPARMATMVNWLYQARARGEARLQSIVAPVHHLLAPSS